MRYVQFTIYVLMALVLLSFAWPLLIGFFILLFGLYVYGKWTARKMTAPREQQEMYETEREIEIPQSDLEVIDLEYEEKE